MTISPVRWCALSVIAAGALVAPAHPRVAEASLETVDAPAGEPVGAPARAAIRARQLSMVLHNGQWFDGTGFQSGDRYIANGVFVARRPTTVDTTIDLHGAFVVPPFAEAHSHNLESSRFEAVQKMYVERGIFYVKNPNSLPRFTEPLRGRINGPGLLDAVFANGGLTGTGGHPTAIAQRQISRGAWRIDEGDGGFYWYIDSPADLHTKWPRILAQHPDFIKTYLLHSEEYTRRAADTAYLDWRGLNPALLPEIAQRAHRAGLRVSTHVETAADFRVAVAAGVDEINHLPGFRPDRNRIDDYRSPDKYVLTLADARRAAAAHVSVVTTSGAIVEILLNLPPDSADASTAQRMLAVLRSNLQRLDSAGVVVAIGSDEYSRTTDFEVQQLARLHAVSTRTLLNWWVSYSPRTIFPSRKLGQLRAGYEGSFIALDKDPLADITNTRSIVLRVKQGVVMP